MTKKEFIYALERGLGRAYTSAVQDSRKYKSRAIEVLSECNSFDVQCEGTRAEYVYRIINALGCTEQLRDIIIKKLLETSNSDMSRDTAYYTEILSWIADQGDESAINALKMKYKSLYLDLSNTKTLPNGIFPERDNFEQICVSLCKNIKAFREIASDIGMLFDSNPCFDCDDFAWFLSKSDCFIKRARRYKKKGRGLERFLEYASKWEEEEEARRCEFEKRKNDPEFAKAARKRFEIYKNRPLFQQIQLPESEEELIAVLKDLDIDKDNESNWHSFHFDIFELLKRNNSPEYLKSALPIIYKTTRCSNCRFECLRLMAEFKMLSWEIIEECLHDSNSDIRTFAKRRINNAKQR